MRTIESLLSEYAESHQNRTNQIIHKICVPLIVFSVIGLIWSIPSPWTNPYLNYASMIAVMVLIYYFILSPKYFVFMFPMFLAFIIAAAWINQVSNLLVVSLLVFVVSWIFQFIGHKIEGKKPSFLKDLLFLLIGPLWVVKALFRLKS
jgi:uncharacterized membrane protein YGL010W